MTKVQSPQNTYTYKCGGSEGMKFFGLLGIYRTGSWIQIGSIYEPGQKLTLIKK